MKKIKTVDAVGQVLCHDMTQIIKDVKKGPAFRKGHIIREEDIPILLSMGKEYIYIWEKKYGMLHENEAAQILCDICKNSHMTATPVQEGKIDLIADIDGVFKVDLERLDAINSLDQIIIAVRNNNYPVKKGNKLAGARVIPLVIETEKLEAAKRIAGNTPLLSILQYIPKKVGIVTTGNEVLLGRIQDTFGPVVIEKLKEFGATILGQKIVGDEPEKITRAIFEFLNAGAEMVVCTGGMSVDPDDRTPAAIKATGSEIISYGAPVLPGAMFLLSYYNGAIPILGLPGCVMYSKRTVFDLVLPRIMAGEILTKKDLVKLGHGGLCLSCNSCHYPECIFGKCE